jgi:hypothetical protein
MKCLRNWGVKNVQVVVYDQKKNGKFSQDKIQNTDNWAIVGANRSATAKQAKETTQSTSYRYQLDQWGKGDRNPETSNYHDEGNKSQGIAIDYNDNARGRGNSDDPDEEAAL